MQLINRLLDLRPGDFSRGLSMFGYYFLIIAAYVICQTVRVPLFFDKFKTIQQPYVDIAVAGLVPIVIALYMWIGRRLALKNLLIAYLVFSAANVVTIWWATIRYPRPWVMAVLYIWVGIFGVLAPAQVWTLANHIWTTREAKRLFGFLASGGTAGSIFAGFFSNYVAPKFGTESLLLVVGFLVAASAALVFVIYRQNGHVDDAAMNDSAETRSNLRESYRLVKKSPHLEAIAALICLSSIVTTSVGWQFNAIAKETFVNKNELAAFIGAFAGYTGIGSLIAQFLITGKLLRRFGVGTALLVLPLSLLGGTTAVLAWGTLWAATLLRGSDKVVRYSIDKSGIELLYLPVDPKIKVQVKSFIDTVIWRLGDGIAGLTVLLFANILHLTPRQLSWVTVPLLTTWVIGALFARRQYVATLKNNIQHVKIGPEKVTVPVLDQFTTNVFAERLNSNDVNEVIYALELFGMAQHANAHSAIRNLLEHPSPHVRKRAITILNNAGDDSVKHQVAGLIGDSNLDVRTEALLYLSRHEETDPLAYVEHLGDFADFSIRSATVSFLMRPGDSQNLVAARFIINGIVDDLADVAQSTEAARTLVVLGELSTEALRDSLSDANVALTIRFQLPDILLQIGTAEAARALGENLVQGDPMLRSKVISALNKLSEFRRPLDVERQYIESAMIAEMMGHYRSYQILGASNGNADDSLKQSMSQEVERIFRLMKLMFPSLDLQNAYLGIQSKDPVVHANALEFLDNTLNPYLRRRLVPLIDAEVSFEERVRLADRFLGFSARA